MRDRWHDMAQTMRHLAVLTDFVPLKWRDLARCISEHCGNKIRASVRAGKNLGFLEFFFRFLDFLGF